MLIRADQIDRAGPGVVTLGQHADAVLQFMADAQDSQCFSCQLERASGRIAKAQQGEAIAKLTEQPGVLRVRIHGRIGTIRARRHQAGIGRFIRCVQAGVPIRRWRGQTAAVDQAPGKGLGRGQSQHRVAQAAADLALGCDEVGGARRVEQVVIGGEGALLVVAVQQRDRRRPGEHAFELPDQVVDSCTPVLAPRAPKGETWCAE